VKPRFYCYLILQHYH